MKLYYRIVTSLCKRFSKLKRKQKNEPALLRGDYSFLGADNALSSTLHFETGLVSNARIFRETKSRDRKFPDGTFQDRKILGPENSRNSIFSRNSRNIFLRKFQDFFLLEQKIPGLLTLLNSWTTNSVTEFSRTFFTFLSL